MGFAQETGYTPSSVATLMDLVMEEINEQFSLSYTTETFLGTNFYKYFYALIQELQKSEVKTSEIFLKLQDYFATTNERISRPVNTNPGIIEKFQTQGFVASLKPMIETDAGKIHICVDVDDGAEDYADTKVEICTLIKNSTAGGTVTMGDQVETLVLSNGQSFDFKYALPDRAETWLRLTIPASENNQFVILSPEEIKEILLANIAAKYQLGKNFEPQRYFTIIDAPWAESVLLEYSFDWDGETGTWASTVFDAEFDDLIDVALARIIVVQE